MFSRYSRFTVVRLLVAAAALACGGWLASQAAAAAELDKLDTSLKLIPEDAAFYSSILHGREMVRAVADSKAWAKVMQLPFVQMGLMQYNVMAAMPNTPPGQIQAFRNSPDGQKLLHLLGDMASEEMFVYGDPSQVKFVELAQDLIGAANSPLVAFDEMFRMMPGRHDARAKAVLETLARDVKLIGVPNVLFGFKVKDAEAAKEHLAKLERLVTEKLDEYELAKIKGRLKREKVDGVEYLVLRLDGGMIPWNEMPGDLVDKLKESEAEEGDVQKIIDRVKTCQLVVALGVRQDYVLLSIGSSLASLETLGMAPRLIDRPELKPLAKHADKQLVAVSYASREMSRELDRQQKNLRNMLETVDQVMAKLELSDEHKERIRKDAKAFVEDLEQRIPEPGAQLGLSFRTSRGLEGFVYNWGTHGRMDGSKPLDLLRHVGGNPIFGLVGRNKVEMADYDMTVKWLKTAYGYFHEFALPVMPENMRETAEKFLAAAMPLFDRLDRANRQMLIPALADGQVAVVIDRKLTSKQFVSTQPPTDKPMPMIEPALICGVSDPDLLKKALSEYRAVINGLITAARESNDSSQIPENAQIPEPKVTDLAGGKLYSLPLPGDGPVQIDKQIVPNIGIGEHVAVASISHDHSRRLLESAPLAVGGVLEDLERPRACAVWLDWAAIVETASPWVDYIIDQSGGDINERGMPKAMIESQVHTVTDVLKSLRKISNEIYFEDGVMVNHGLAEIRDVDK